MVVEDACSGEGFFSATVHVARTNIANDPTYPVLDKYPWSS